MPTQFLTSFGITAILLIENKILYTLEANSKPLEGYKYIYSETLYPSLKITPTISKPKITLACYGEILHEVEQVARQLLIELEFFIEITTS